MSDRYFPKVKEAREALAAKALSLYESYEMAIKAALEQGKMSLALEHMQWLIEHMPNEEGVRMIDSSAAKPMLIETGNKGPTIQIGIQLSGLAAQKSLPESKTIPESNVIDVEKIEDE